MKLLIRSKDSVRHDRRRMQAGTRRKRVGCRIAPDKRRLARRGIAQPIGGDEIHGASAEAAARHARAVDAWKFDRFVDQEIDLRAGDLVVLFHAAMRSQKSLPMRNQIVRSCRIRQMQNALRIRDDMAGTTPRDFRHIVFHLFEHFRSDVAQAFYLGKGAPYDFDRLTAFSHTMAVSRRAEFVFHERVYGDDLNRPGKLYVFVAEATAIELDGGAFLPENGGVLVHDAARHADKLRFRALADLRDLERLEARAKKRHAGGNLDAAEELRPEPAGLRSQCTDSQACNGTASRTSSRATPTT